MPLPKPKPFFEPELASFADIAFLLIIFFILTTTFIVPAGNKLDIPAASADPERAEDKQLTVTLIGEEIHYGPQAEKVTLDELRRNLFGRNFRAKPPDKRIVIVNARADVPYELYFDVVMAIHHADGVLALLEEEGKAKK